MTTEEFLIHELAERAGVSVRTIRYYIEEGLLPQPNYEGKYSYYSPSFLERLELIRRLKDSYLPLREIREILNSLSDEEVRDRLKQTQPGVRFAMQTATPQAKTKPGARALEYIDRVMDNQNKVREKGIQEKSTPILEQDQARMQQPLINQPESSPAPAREETWQRIMLAPGVELHIHRPLDTGNESRVRQIIIYAQKIFSHRG